MMKLNKIFKSRKKELGPLRTSPGKLRTYLQCGRKYKFIYVDQKKGSATSKVHLDFDGMINRAVESFQKSVFLDQRDIPSDEYKKKVGDFWQPEVFQEGAERDQFETAALKSCEVMTTWFRQKAGLLIPYQGKPAVGIFAAWYPHPITVWTRLDRMEKCSDGSLRAIDFKSGARQTTTREMKYDLGIRLQLAAAREQFGSKVTRFALVYLRTGDTFEVSADDLELNRLQDDVFAIARKMQEGEFPSNQGPLCSVCKYLEQCDGWKSLPWKTVNETRDVYSKRLRLSYSKMSLYERCPRAFKKLYEDKISPKPQPFFSFGSCIHEIMEGYYDKNVEKKRTLEFLLQLLEERWRENRVGYRNEEEESLYKEKSHKMVVDYYNRFVKNQTFTPAAAIEDYFEIPVGKDSIMAGFIDRIDKLPEGGFIVLDYKTEPTDRSQEAVDKDLQLTLYYWASKTFLNLNIKQLGLFMMSFDKLVTTTRSEDDIPLLMERIEEVTRQIRHETDFKPKMNKYCLSCDHLGGCPLEDDIRCNPDLRSMEFKNDDLTSAESDGGGKRE